MKPYFENDLRASLCRTVATFRSLHPADDKKRLLRRVLSWFDNAMWPIIVGVGDVAEWMRPEDARQKCLDIISDLFGAAT